MDVMERALNNQNVVKNNDRTLALESLYEKRLHALIISCSGVIYRMSPDWSEMHQLQGNGFFFNTENTKGDWLHDYIHPDDQIHVTLAINKAIQAKSVYQLEHRFLQADGSLRWASSRAIPIMNENGEIVEWFGEAYDITERKKREENLSFLAEISKDLSNLSSANEIMNTIGEKIGRHLNITNCLFAEVNELKDELIVRYAWHHEDDLNVIGERKLSSFVTEEFRKIAREGKTVIINNTQTDRRTNANRYEALNIHTYVSVPFHRDKEWKYLFTITDTIARKWSKGEIELIEEVTNRIFPRLERAYAEEAMRISEEKYRTFFEHISEGLSIFEIIYNSSGNPKDFRYIEINRAYEDHTGLKAINIIGKTLLDVIPDLEQSWIDVLVNVAVSGESIRYENYNQSTQNHYETFVFSPKKDHVALLLRNITERKKLEVELKSQKELFEVVIENMHDALAIYNPMGELIFLNAKSRKMYPHLDEKTTLNSAYNNFQFFDLDHNVLPIEKLPTARVIKGEKIRNEKILIKRPDRNQYTEINATPNFDENGHITSVVVSHRDISDMIQNQQTLKEQQEKLIKTEKEKSETLEAAIKLKDEFLYLITHEFKTPMTVICSALQAIDFICKGDVTERMGRYLNSIKINTNRQLRLVNNLLDITKINSGNIHLKMSNFDIVYVTKSIVKSVEIYASQKRVTINFVSTLAKKEIYIDEEKFERILLNLLSNALKFTTPDTFIYVSVSVVKHDKKNFISIVVKDEGVGIPLEKQKVIFERFGQADTSLSRRAEGTGLGLYLVTLLVRAMGGEISVQSEEGKGSAFTVLLPATKPKLFNEVDISKEIIINNQFNSGDDRIIQAISTEFSDIYFD
ncbi:MAG: putative sensor kinase [Bacillales bacterium]|jgi:signal transduction histidine kinase|nr:putative sensor kinase [Bacillales bacterium]